MDALDALVAGTRNEACAKARVAKVDFKNLPKFDSGVNFCEVPVAKLPADVRALIEKVGELNEKVAAFLGQDLDETFGMDVEITVTDGTLRLRAHREERTEDKRPDGYRSEFRYGSFERSLPLPEGASATDVKATYKDGVLEVRVPMPPAAEAEAVKVSVEHS